MTTLKKRLPSRRRSRSKRKPSKRRRSRSKRKPSKRRRSRSKRKPSNRRRSRSKRKPSKRRRSRSKRKPSKRRRSRSKRKPSKRRRRRSKRKPSKRRGSRSKRHPSLRRRSRSTRKMMTRRLNIPQVRQTLFTDNKKMVKQKLLEKEEMPTGQKRLVFSGSFETEGKHLDEEERIENKQNFDKVNEKLKKKSETALIATKEFERQQEEHNQLTRRMRRLPESALARLLPPQIQTEIKTPVTTEETKDDELGILGINENKERWVFDDLEIHHDLLAQFEEKQEITPEALEKATKKAKKIISQRKLLEKSERKLEKKRQLALKAAKELQNTLEIFTAGNGDPDDPGSNFSAKERKRKAERKRDIDQERLELVAEGKSGFVQDFIDLENKTEEQSRPWYSMENYISDRYRGSVRTALLVLKGLGELVVYAKTKNQTLSRARARTRMRNEMKTQMETKTQRAIKAKARAAAKTQNPFDTMPKSYRSTYDGKYQQDVPFGPWKPRNINKRINKEATMATNMLRAKIDNDLRGEKTFGNTNLGKVMLREAARQGEGLVNVQRHMIGPQTKSQAFLDPAHGEFSAYHSQDAKFDYPRRVERGLKIPFVQRPHQILSSTNPFYAGAFRAARTAASLAGFNNEGDISYTQQLHNKIHDMRPEGGKDYSAYTNIIGYGDDGFPIMKKAYTAN